MSCRCVTEQSAISHPVEHSHQYFFVPDRITTLSLFDPFFVFYWSVKGSSGCFSYICIPLQASLSLICGIAATKRMGTAKLGHCKIKNFVVMLIFIV